MRSTAIKLSAAVTLLMTGILPSANSQSAQPINVVTTAVPFLRISPDARAGALQISPIPPARASGEILKNGTAVVTTLIG